MPRRPVIIAVHQLGYGGVTNAVIDQSGTFAAAGHPTTIATLTDDLRLPVRVGQLREDGRLHPEVTVVNLFQEAASAQSRPVPASRRARHVLRDLLHRVRERLSRTEKGEDDGGRYVRSFDRTENVERVARFDAAGRKGSVEVYAGEALIRREVLVDGVVRKVVDVDPENGVVTRERHYSSDGFCFMERTQSPVTRKGTGVSVFDRDGGRPQRFSGLPAWGTAWLRQVAERQPDRPLLIAESPSVIPKISRIPGASATRLGMLHNNQWAPPHEPGSPIRNDHTAILEAIDRLDALVVLTEQQRADLVDLVGVPDKVHVVPNSVIVPDLPPIARDPRLVSVVSRLSPQKALDEAVAAMGLVLEAVPEARLEIYGRGPERDRLRSVIEAAGLADRILLMGRTDEPAEAMARSVCTLSTSNWEAMPLSILESMAAGTPVVAYDCRYGPAALIDDGVTGRLIRKGDQRALAEAVIALLADPGTADSMGRAARAAVLERHSPEHVGQVWEELFATLDPSLPA